MLNDLKLMLGIASDDTDRDSLLKLIVSSATARLKTLLGGLEPTEELDYIILDVCIRRFNRIGSEGMESHTVEGESITFSASDFAGFEDDIQAYLDTQKESARGRVRFI
jgi:hypothetical protein